MAQIRTIKKARDTGRLDRAAVRAVVAAMREREIAGSDTRADTAESEAGHGLNKSALIQRLTSRTDLSRAAATRAVDALFSVENGIIAEALRTGDKVQITGFGSFETKRREARKGRNPRTGKEVDIPSSTSASFRAGKGLKDSLSADTDA